MAVRQVVARVVGAVLSSDEHLIVFARIPRVGANKTRLIPALGAENATRVYRHLVERTLSQVRHFATEQHCDVTLCFTGGTVAEAQAEFGTELDCLEQVGATLGDRLQQATQSSFAAGAKRVVVIGTDCPGLTALDLKAAFEQLVNHDVVIGPAHDGGYYLIGLRVDQAALFADVDWSTSIVFQQTMNKAQSLGSSVYVLGKKSDVDYPEDLLPLRHNSKRESFPLQTQNGKLSVIIPTFNEELNLPATLRSVGVPGADLEIIVVDAGSTDQTLAVAQQFGCHAFVGNPGRANQMNAGAALASGEYLLFLHADTRLPAAYRHELQQVLGSPVACGAFPLKIDAPGISLRMIEAGVAFRSRVLQSPYGDQALFFRAADFYEHQGFKPMAIMEDYELVARIRKTGRIGLAKTPVQTSARRWIRKGILRTTIVNQLCLLAFWFGFSDKTIAELYRGRRQ